MARVQGPGSMNKGLDCESCCGNKAPAARWGPAWQRACLTASRKGTGGRQPPSLPAWASRHTWTSAPQPLGSGARRQPGFWLLLPGSWCPPLHQTRVRLPHPCGGPQPHPTGRQQWAEVRNQQRAAEGLDSGRAGRAESAKTVTAQPQGLRVEEGADAASEPVGA